MDKALADAPDGQISLIDPDARAMATSARHSGMVGYNVQTAANTETRLIVAHQVTNRGFDRDRRSPMATAAKGALARPDLHAIADKSYFSGTEILACQDVGITTTLPHPTTSGNAAKGNFVKADFAYDADHDVYVCPAGEKLIHRCTCGERGVQFRRYWINECQTCPSKANAPPAMDGGSPGSSKNIWSMQRISGLAMIQTP